MTILAGETAATYSVTTQDDVIDEQDGSVTVEVTAGTGYTVGTASSASVAVNDDDYVEDLPSFQSAEVDGTALTVTFDRGLDASGATKPASSVFTVTATGADSTSRTIRGSGLTEVAINGAEVTATLKSAVARSETVTLAYTRPDDEPLRDTSDPPKEVRSFSGKAVTVEPPQFASASVNGAVLTVTFDGNLDENSEPAASRFTVTVGGTAVDLADTNPVDVSGATVVLTLAEAVLRIETVSVAYAAGDDASPLRSAGNASNPVPDFAAQTVTNDTPADTTAPGSPSATIDGDKLTLTFDEPLKESAEPPASAFMIANASTSSGLTITGVDVTGSTVVLTNKFGVKHGHEVWVTYSPPAADGQKLQDLSGNPAPAIPPWKKDVTNNTPPAFSEASVNGAALTITFDGNLDENSEPAASRFTVKATRSGTERSVALAATDPVDVSGSTVVLTLAEAVLRVDTVTVAYAAGDDANPLRDSDNAKNPVADFAAQTATNGTPADTTGPAFESASMNGVTVVYTFDEALDDSVTLASGFFQRGIGQDWSSATAARISGRTVSTTWSWTLRPSAACF